MTTCPWNESFSEFRAAEPVFINDPSEVWNPPIRFISGASDVYMKNDFFGEDITMTAEMSEPNVTFKFALAKEGLFDADCDLNLANFPFDLQQCSFSFSMRRDISSVRFDGEPVVAWGEKVATTQWRFVGTQSFVTSNNFLGRNVSVVDFRFRYAIRGCG